MGSQEIVTILLQSDDDSIKKSKYITAELRRLSLKSGVTYHSHALHCKHSISSPLNLSR